MEDYDLLTQVLNKDILVCSDLNEKIQSVKKENERLLVELNTNYRSNEEMLSYLEKITQKSIDSSNTIFQPFYSDFVRHIVFGKNIFILLIIMCSLLI